MPSFRTIFSVTAAVALLAATSLAAQAGGDVPPPRPKHSAPYLKRHVASLQREIVVERDVIVAAPAPAVLSPGYVVDGPRWHRRGFVGRYVGGNHAYDRVTVVAPVVASDNSVEIARSAPTVPVGKPYGAEAEVAPGRDADFLELQHSFQPVSSRSQAWAPRTRPAYQFGYEYELEDNRCWRSQVLQTEAGWEARRVWTCPGS